MKKKDSGNEKGMFVYKVSFTAVFSKDIDKNALSDAVFKTLQENTENLSMLNVESIRRCRKSEEEAREILMKYIDERKRIAREEDAEQ